MNATERYGEQLFNSTGDHERTRLDSLAAAFDAASSHRLAALNLQPGWTCLDVGAGTGTVSRALADIVGPHGQVTACDLDTRFLTEDAHPEITVLQADITDPDTAPGQFDVVHARFVLMHLRGRDHLLPKLVSWVRPGGYLVISDSADLGTPTSPHAACRETMRSLWHFLDSTIGTDINYGRRHPAALAELGLADITMHTDLPTLVPGAPLTIFWLLTLQQTLPRMLADGRISPDIAQQAQSYLSSRNLRDLSLAMITTCGRKPVTTRPDDPST